jgi:hypothetical protein
MERFQDITITSKFIFVEDNLKHSQEYLRAVHQAAADSLHSTNKFTLLYKNIIDEKANALLMDTDTINFHHYNLGIVP